MIVQTAPDGAAHFVIKQVDHAVTSGQFARAFGNEQFAELAPKSLMEYVVTHHDDGWKEVDEDPGLDAKTRLPNHLTQTPTLILAHTSATTPQRNEDHHPYCGIISSMHSWGLYNGRYGLSDKIYIDMISSDYRAKVDAMLQGELDRQQRLKDSLADNTEFTPLIAENVLFHNYKLLQFFDTLALYFQTQHSGAHNETEFKNVPMSVDNDATLTLTPLGEGKYKLSPYPFHVDSLEFGTVGRYISPYPDNVTPDLKQVMAETSTDEQRFTLVPE